MHAEGVDFIKKRSKINLRRFCNSGRAPNIKC